MDVKIACICPVDEGGAAPHTEDTVVLADTLDFRTTLIIRQEIRFAGQIAREGGEVMGVPEMTAVMAEAYILNCIVAWTVRDEKGKPLPPSKANIWARLLTNYEAAEDVGDAADELYSEKVVLPLIQGASSSSSGTPTETSMSPTSTPGRTPRKPSKRSSTSTSPMVVTGPMAASPGGASNSSLR